MPFSPEKPMPKQVKPLDAIAVARAYYALPVKERKYENIARQFGLRLNHTSANRLARVVRRLEEDGRIHHEVVDAKTQLLPRCPQLEEKMRHKFGVRQVIVVDISSIEKPVHNEQVFPEMWAIYDDDIHASLGAWGGRLIASNLRPGDKISTGGGRGPYYAAIKTNITLNQHYTGAIQPLTGKIGARAWNPEGPQDGDPPLMDADKVADAIRGRINSNGKLHKLDCSITDLKHTPRTDNVDVAIFGIGALGGGHRLCEHEHLADVRTVNSLLTEINDLAEVIENMHPFTDPPYFHPVGDVCNCYFMIEPENGEGKRPEWRQLEANLQKLNKAFKSATPEALGKIARRGFVLAVAGGLHKAYAIRHVLRKNRDQTWLTHLVTDHVTSRWILDQEKMADAAKAKAATKSSVRPSRPRKQAT